MIECHKIIYDYEIYRCLKDERENHWDQLSDTAKTALESARERTPSQYQEALEILEAANTWFRQFFNDYDAILTPSATGEAVTLSEGTGNPSAAQSGHCADLPCLSLPLLAGEDDLPIGIQLVAGLNEDDRLFRTSRWLLNYLHS